MAEGPNSPEEAHRLWAEYFNAGDLDALVSLYEPEATLNPRRGPPVTGIPAIRELLAGFMRRKESFEIEVGKALRSGDVALMASTWKFRGFAEDGGPIDVTGRTADVLRRQPDGSWRFVIDSPYGEGA